ncbi:MAG: hypothetical protein ACOYJL_09740 [Tractidigestivibacter sp.]|jgi:hypothetical protein|uniref:hypothetical protein n=1 Tax=Tractidigestivibacter sp. TaxID=2847320 RepID=UPI003D93EC13
MGIYLGHESALRYWLTKRGDECVPDRLPLANIADGTASLRDLEAAPLPFDFSERRPLSVLVACQARLRKSSEVSARVLKARLPMGSFCELAGSTAVASPELTYLLMAQDSSVVDAAIIGSYLCSGFSIGEDGRGYVGSREPLVTPKEISNYLDKVPGAYGIKTARRALKYVVPNTASPMEVLLALSCSLPPLLGGRSMPPVIANQRIAVPDELLKLAGTDSLYGDLFFAKVKGDLEYDSNEYHTGKFRSDHTFARRNVIEAAGVKVVSATWGQMRTFEMFNTFWWLVERNFGLRHHSFNERQRAAQEELYLRFTDKEFRLF